MKENPPLVHYIKSSMKESVNACIKNRQDDVLKNLRTINACFY